MFGYCFVSKLKRVNFAKTSRIVTMDGASLVTIPETTARHISTRLRAVSLFSWSVEQNARDTQMTTRVNEGARRERHFFLLGLPPSFLASRGFPAHCSRARAIPLLNLKKKRDCSQSTFQPQFPSRFLT